MNAHHEYGPSTLAAIERCSGFKNDNTKDVHPVTEEGQRCHDAIETGDYSRLNSDHEFNLVKLCEDYLKKLPEPVEVWTEQRVDVIEVKNDEGIYDTIFGTFDRLHQNDSEFTSGELIDFKFGWHEVEDAETNLQGQCYVLGVFTRYPTLQTLRVHFVMPRIGKISRHTYTRDDLDRIRLRILRVYAQAMLPPSQKSYNPSFKNCQYCGQKAHCPAMFKKIASVASSYVDDLTVPEFVHPSQIKDPVILGQLRDLAAVMEGWVESVKFHTTQARRELGIELPGWKLVEKKGVRSVTNNLAAWRLALSKGITPEEIAEHATTISLGGLTDLVRSKAGHRKKKRAEQDFLDELLDANAMTEGSPTYYLKKQSHSDDSQS